MLDGKISPRLYCVLFLILFVFPFTGLAQYDYEHYVPPFYNGSSNNGDIGRHTVVLSTNSTNDVNISIYKGDGTLLNASEPITITRGQPYEYVFVTPGGGDYGSISNYPYNYNFPFGVIGAVELNKPLVQEGLRFVSTDGPFFVNIRHVSNVQGGSLTTKGTYAKGTEFLSGHLYTDAWHAASRRSHFISVMAVENTVVTFTDIKCSYLTKYNEPGQNIYLDPIAPADSIVVSLNAGESYLIAVDHEFSEFNSGGWGVWNGMNGTSITSTEPIVVTSGSWTSGPDDGQDMGFDQIVPVEELRDQHVVMRGKGDRTTERVIVVATENDTEVWVNGSLINGGDLLQRGEFLVLDDFFDGSGNPIHDNLFIDTKDKSVYVYQTMSGDDKVHGPTVGVNFIPPLSATGIKEVTVPFADYLAEKQVQDAVITILTQKNAQVEYQKTVGATTTYHTISTSDAIAVPGNTEWVSYTVDNIEGNYRFNCNKAINVAWVVRSNYVGAAGYYSGFTKAISKITPNLDIDVDLDLICESYDDDIRVSIKDPKPDFYEWYVNEISGGPFIENGPLVIPAPDVETSYYVIGYYRDPGLDILHNGDFSDGTNLIESDYELVVGNLTTPGQFAIASSPQNENPIFEDFSAMDGGYMFVAYSKDQGDTIYKHYETPVEENFNYILKLNGRLAKPNDGINYFDQSVKVLINSDTVIDNFKIDDTANWNSISALWKAGESRKATVKIVNNNPSAQDAVFALDSISFVQAVQDTAVFVARVVPNYSYDNNGGTIRFCLGTANSIDISNGDTSWYDYSWSKKDGETYVALTDNAEYSGTQTHELSFANPQKTHEGEYRCTISFKEEYQQCGSSGSDVEVGLILLVDEPATIDIETTGLNFCYGTNATLTALVTGDAGAIEWYVNGGEDPVSVENPFVFSGYDAGIYTVRCESENGCGIVSDEIDLEVLSAPNLTNLSVNADLCEGENIVLTAEATGNGNLTYYWKEGTDELTEQGAVLTFRASMYHRFSNFSVNVSSVYTIGEDTVECPDEEISSIDKLDIYPLVMFSTELKNATLCEGHANHTFSVELAQAENYYNYAWLKDGAPQPETISEKIISPVTIPDAGEYKVTVSNRCDSKESIAILSVTPKLVVNNITLDDLGPFCVPTNVTVTFDDNGAVSKYWARNQAKGITVDPITNPYTFEINATNEGTWEFLVEGNCGSDPVSQSFTLNMIPDFGSVSIEDITSCIGKDVDFIADIDYIPALSTLTYVWEDNNGNPIGGNSETLSLNDVQETNVGTYSCKVTDQCSREKTAIAKLAIEKVTTATTASAIEKCVGDTDFRIDIAYLGSPIFEWRFNDPNGTVISNADFYEIASVSFADAGVYYCTVTLNCGDEIRIERELLVKEHISIVSPADETIHICQGEKPILEVEVNGNANDYVTTWTDNMDVDLGYGDVNQVQMKVHNSVGTFTYKAKVNGDCDNLEKIYHVEVHEKPLIDPVDPISACEGDIPLSIVIAGTDYDHVEWWDSDESTQLGTGVGYTITGATHPSSDGTYIAKVVTDYCGDVRVNALVDVYEPIGMASTSNLNPVPCVGEPLALVVNGTGEGVGYKWYVTSVPAVVLSTANSLDLGVADLSDTESYTCEVLSSNGCTGTSAVFNVNVKQHAAITDHPDDVSICESDSPADFNVTATGEGSLIYTWYDKNNAVVGGNSPTLSIADPAANDGQNYYCVISGEYCDDATSETAGLHVIQEVAVDDHPASLTIAETGNAEFAVTVLGDPVYTYQWEESTNGGGAWSAVSDGGKYSGATTAMLTISNVDEASFNNNQYRCVVSNVLCAASSTSNVAILTVDLLAKITLQPQNIEACIGDTGKSFTVDATGSGLTYTWEYRENNGDSFIAADGMSVSNGGKTLDLPAVTSAMASWEFRCTVSGTGPSDTSNTVKINVFEPIDFVDVADLTLCTGVGAHFEAVINSGTTPYIYSWKRGVAEIGTGPQLNLSSAQATDASYSISVDNGVCAAITDNFTIDHYTDLSVDPWANTNKACVNGTSVVLTVTATTDARQTLTYVWTKDDDATVLGSSSTYTIPGISSTETGLYKVKVEDGCGSQAIAGFVNVYDPISKNNNWEASRTLCLDDELILEVDVTGDVPSYSWDVPNVARTTNNQSSIKFDNVSSADDGVYTCTVTGECGNPVVYTIDVNILSAPDIASGIDAIPAVCENAELKLGPITVNNSYDELIWTLNDDSGNSTAGLTLDLGTADLSEEGNYKVTARNMCGEDVSVGAQVVNPTPSLNDIEPQIACQGDDVVFRANTTGRNLSYQWLVDGVDQLVNSPELVLDGSAVQPFDANAPLIYDIECKIESSDGCGQVSKLTSLTVNPNTILQTTLKNAVVYVGGSYTMTLDITGIDLVYEWTHEVDGIKTPLPGITGSSIDFTNISMWDAGYYNCRITGTCGQRLASGKLTVKEPVNIVDGPDALAEKCVDEPLSLSLNVTGQMDSIKWYKDDILVLQGELNYYISELDLGDAGIYTYKIWGEGVDLIEKSITLRVYPLTTLNAPIGNLSLCEGDVLDWIPDVSGASDLTYKWIFEGAEVHNGRILHYDNLLLGQEGGYEVQITGLCGDVSTNGNLEITQLPVFVSASGGQDVCENTSLVEFSVEYGGENLQYQWMKDEVNMPGKTSPVLSLTSIQLEDDATYQCKVYNNCGELTSPEAHLTVIPQLQIVTQPTDVEVCAGEEVVFVAEVVGNNVSYQWKSPDGNDMTGETSPTFAITNSQPNQSGYYTCLVSDNCTALPRSTKPSELTVNTLPNSEIFGRMRLCVKEDRVTYVTIDQPEIEYGWGVEGGIFAGPEEGLKTRVTWKEVANGELSIIISDLETGCVSKIDSLVTLHALPLVSLDLQETKGVCEDTFELSGGNPAGGIYWVDGISQELFNPSERGPGDYAVHYSYTDENGCSDVTEIKNLSVEASPVVDITDDTTIGVCSPFQLTASTSENNIQWSPANNLDNANSMNPVFTPGESQVLAARVTDEHGCAGVDLVNLTVAPLPIVTTIPDTTVSQCNQLELTTDIVGDMAAINWSYPEHLDNAKVHNPRITNASAGTYTYTISVTDLYGCDAQDEATVTVVADPVLDEDQFGCEGDQFEVNIAGMENPVWDDGYSDVLRNIDAPGQYLLEVSNDFDCSDEQLFVINPTPDLNLKDTLIFEGETTTLAPNLPSDYGPYLFEWQDGSIFPDFEVAESGTYTLRIEDNLGCVAIDSAYVEVKPVGIESPSAFTPKSNNENNKFYLKDISVVEEFEMYVYDRWGELLFKTDETGYNGGWDGRYKGKLCPAGAYVWIAFINGELTNKGTFVLVR